MRLANIIKLAFFRLLTDFASWQPFPVSEGQMEKIVDRELRAARALHNS